MFPHTDQSGLDVIVSAGLIEIRLGDQIVYKSGVMLQNGAVSPGHSPLPELIHIPIDQGKLPGQGSSFRHKG